MDDPIVIRSVPDPNEPGHLMYYVAGPWPSEQRFSASLIEDAASLGDFRIHVISCTIAGRIVLLQCENGWAVYELLSYDPCALFYQARRLASHYRPAPLSA